MQHVSPDFLTMLTAPFAAPIGTCTTLHPSTYHTALCLAIDLSIHLLVSSIRTGLMSINRCVPVQEWTLLSLHLPTCEIDNV